VSDAASLFDVVEGEDLAYELDLMMYCSMASMVSSKHAARDSR